MLLKQKLSAVIFSVAFAGSGLALAELTQMGAEQSANAAGTISAWMGGISQPPKAYVAGKQFPNPFADEKPLFTITAENVPEYEAHLTEGQKALFQTYPETFNMPVYKSHRTAAYPQTIYNNTLKCSESARLQGWGIDGCVGGTPFPTLKGNDEEKAVQAIWNHVLRYRGQFISRRTGEAVVQKNGFFVPLKFEHAVDFKYYDPAIKTVAELNNILFYYLSEAVAPAKISGNAMLIHETLDQREQGRLTWVYLPGQRRVAPIPTVAYDTPIPAADGVRTADDTDMFSGSPDKYNWRLVGKKEMYIPYNNYRVDDKSLSYKDILTPNHPNPDLLRYELHRVWVVEGDLKEGEKHIYAKRRFYIDEDSWSIAAADQYDHTGNLWRVSMAYLKNFYEVPMVWTALDVFHDLKDGRYNVQQLDNEAGDEISFVKPKLSSDHFTQAALRRRGVR